MQLDRRDPTVGAPLPAWGHGDTAPSSFGLHPHQSGGQDAQAAREEVSRLHHRTHRAWRRRWGSHHRTHRAWGHQEGPQRRTHRAWGHPGGPIARRNGSLTVPTVTRHGNVIHGARGGGAGQRAAWSHRPTHHVAEHRPRHRRGEEQATVRLGPGNAPRQEHPHRQPDQSVQLVDHKWRQQPVGRARPKGHTPAANRRPVPGACPSEGERAPPHPRRRRQSGAYPGPTGRRAHRQLTQVVDQTRKACHP